MMISRALAWATIFSRSSAPPAALDDAQLRVNLVGPVYRQVDAWMTLKRRQWNAQTLRVSSHLVGTRYAKNVGERALRQPCGDTFERHQCGAARA